MSETICAFCYSASLLSTQSSWESRHQPTYSALKESALAGCQLCRFLRQALLVEYAHGPCRTIKAAEEYHLEVDQEPDASAFIILNLLVEVDFAFAPFSEGSAGLNFIRRYDDEDTVPVGDIWTLIAFEVPFGSIAQSLGQIIGAPVSPEVDLSVAKDWIRDCDENHRELCCGVRDTALPTRIIDVGTSDQSDHVKLVISNNSRGRYVTLSHRWGDLRPITLTAETKAAFLQGIPFISLPRTFQDAVTITRQLGIRYLWIDSLCILQDCREDWEKAVVEMPNIYRLGEINICGPAAASCDAGFLHRRKIPEEWLDIEWHVFDHDHTETVRLVYKGPMEREVPQKEPESALSTRGWILQERLLCRRMLYFGSRQIYWECITNASYESLHFPVPHDYQRRDEVTKFSFSAAESHTRWLRTWYELVVTYSEMDLSYQTDKFPAISALAERFSKVLGDEYIAGLWRSDLRRGLTWYIPSYVKRTEIANQSNSYIAPSWSWASTTSKISFSNIVYELHNSDTFVDAMAVPRTPYAFGSLKDAQLTLTGSPFAARIVWSDDDWVEGRKVWKAYPIASDVELGIFYPDHTIPGDIVPHLLFLEIGHFADPGAMGIYIAVGKHPAAPAKYCRLGLLLGTESSGATFDEIERAPRATFELL